MNQPPSSAAGPSSIPYSAEIKRKAIHLCSLGIPAAIWYLPKSTVILVLGAALAGSVLVDILRRVLSPDARGWRHLAALFRPSEKEKLSGSSYLLLAALFLTVLFSREVAVLALIYIVVGDVAGALVGRRFGRHPLFDKTWEGSSAFFLACIIFSALVPGLPFWAKFCAAAVATLVELLPLKLDDNLTVPLGTAGFLTLILRA